MTTRYRFVYQRKVEGEADKAQGVIRVSSPVVRWKLHPLPRRDVEIAELFDGKRSVEEVMDAFRRATGVTLARSDVDELVSRLGKLGFMQGAGSGEAPSPPPAQTTSGSSAAPRAGHAAGMPGLRSRQARSGRPPDGQPSPSTGRPARPVLEGLRERRARAMRGDAGDRVAVADRRAPARRADPPADIAPASATTRAGEPAAAQPGLEPRTGVGPPATAGARGPSRPVLGRLPVAWLVPVAAAVARPLCSPWVVALLMVTAAAAGYVLSQDAAALEPWFRGRNDLDVLLPVALLVALWLNFSGQLARLALMPVRSEEVASLALVPHLGVIPGFSADGVEPAGGAGEPARRASVAPLALALLSLLAALGVLRLSLADGAEPAMLALVAAAVCALWVIAGLNPLRDGPLSQWLGATFAVAWLRERVLLTWIGFDDARTRQALRARPLPKAASGTFLLLTLAYLVALLGIPAAVVAPKLPASYHLPALVVALLAATLVVVPAVSDAVRLRRFVEQSEAARRLRRGSGKSRGGARRWWRYALLLVVGGALFLPYPYETSGNFELLPPRKQEINANVAGEVVELNYDTGEWVSAGSVVAQLDDSEQAQAVRSTRESITKQEAIEELRRLQLEFSENELARMQRMYDRKLVSAQEYENANEKVQTNTQELAAVRTELGRLRQQLEFFEAELERTRIRMPFDGQLVTPLLQQKLGTFLREGDTLTVAEDARTIRAQVGVPEFDIGEIALGAQVRLKVWAYPTTVFTGRVSSIDPTAVETRYGRVVNVLTDVPNTDHVLKSGMTGIAKVEAGTKFVIVAFTRMLVRFFLIEVWSWIP